MDNVLKPIREKIDELDVELLRLINERMQLVKEVGRIKAAGGLALFDPGREERIYDRLSKINPGPLTTTSLRAIYREILSASRLLQYPLQIAFLGPEWTHSHVAALALFGHTAQYLPLPSLEDVFDALLKGMANVAVVPIENSLEGGIGRTIDLLHEREAQVVRECYLEVAHYIGSKADSPGSLRHLYAHPQDLEQCRKWLQENLPQIECHECKSTAQAAQKAENDPAGAAICNLYAAYHHQLHVMYERIEDNPGGVIRFFALAKHSYTPTENDKTSILFAAPDQPGALHSALEPFVRFNVNMTRIESRPNRLVPWQYLFFADIDGNRDAGPVKEALSVLSERVSFLKVLGSYPKGDPKRPIRVNKEDVRSGAVDAAKASHIML